MTAYDAPAWSTFALAVVIASAALAGLLVVALAPHLPRILRDPALPARAAAPPALLSAVLVAALLVLLPGQPDVALGVEVAVLGLVLAIAAITELTRASPVPGTPRHRTVVPAAAVLAPAAALVVGGISVEVGVGGGLYWVAAGCLLGILGALAVAWSVLVEVVGG